MAEKKRPLPISVEGSPPEWFRKLYRAVIEDDEEALDEAWGVLYYLGWEVSHRGDPPTSAPKTERCYRPDERAAVRIWGFAPLAGLTIKDLCQRIDDNEVPLPQDYDELGPSWDRGVVDRWIKRKGLDR